MQTEPITRHSPALPELRFSLSLLYVGRFLLGMQTPAPALDDGLDAIDERIEELTDELVATELLHEAAVLAGDVVNQPPLE
ncbi:hypothetical protein DYU11_17920 [Fibrisoma montanum]|uniref:Uncharacterized protein n=1 Tax=Fibrisoma montanum TaxID=2305895 RepID=A0A418M5R7_9BACT|nr:hypothetical protein [Fibrisoma montanum]RIV21288.1 hypothetical protein DYU11_17920 [Fibrisoma montanum]